MLTLGYRSIFSLICASLRDLVISGVSSSSFLGRNKHTVTIKRTENQWNQQWERQADDVSSSTLTQRQIQIAVVGLIVIAVIDTVVAKP